VIVNSGFELPGFYIFLLISKYEIFYCLGIIVI